MARIPTQYDNYRQQVLDVMVEEASPDGDGVLVWEGALTTLVDRVTRRHGNYQKVADPLKESGCIRLLRRGGGGGGSLFEIRRTQYLVDDEGNDVLYDAADASPTRKNETQILQLGRRMNDYDRLMETYVEQLIALANQVQALQERVDKLDGGQTVSTEQDPTPPGGDDSGSEPTPEHGVRSLRVVEEGESLSRRLGLTSDPTVPGSA